MKTPLLVLVASILFSLLGFSSIIEEGQGVVFGSDHAFSLKAPKGWMLDNESGASQGAHAVFYPKGGTWSDSPIIAYAAIRPKTVKIATADDAANEVVRDFHANDNPNYTAQKVKNLKSDSGKEIVIYHFSGDQWGNSEAVAYFVEDKVINYIVMNSRDPQLFKDSLEAFEALAKSYDFLGVVSAEKLKEFERLNEKKSDP